MSTIEHTPVSGKAFKAGATSICTPLLDCDGVYRKAGTIEKRSVTFPPGSALVGAPFTETISTCCAATGAAGKRTVTKQRVSFRGSKGATYCVESSPWDCCASIIVCCTPNIRVPNVLTLKLLPGYEGYGLTAPYDSSPPGFLTAARPPFKHSSGSGFTEPAYYETWGKSGLFDGVTIPLDLVTTPTPHYVSRGNTYCGSYIDDQSIQRNLDGQVNRYRFWTGTISGVQFSMDLAATLSPCVYSAGGVLTANWVLDLMLFVVRRRSPYGACDIDSVGTVQSSMSTATGRWCNLDVTAITPLGANAPTLGGFTWNYYYQNVRPYAGPFTFPPNSYSVDLGQDDPCVPRRPIRLWLGNSPQYGGSDANHLFDRGTGTCFESPEGTIGGITTGTRSSLDGVIFGKSKHFYYFNADLMCMPNHAAGETFAGGNILPTFSPSAFFETGIYGLGVPWRYTDTDKRNQYLTVGVEINE